MVVVGVLRASRTLPTTPVTTSLTDADPWEDQVLAKVAEPPHTHARLALVNQVLPASFTRTRERNLLFRVVVAGDDGGVLFLRADNGLSSFAIGSLFSLVAFGRVTSATLASGMLAVGALFAGTEGCLAFVALAMYAHADGLFDPQYVALGRLPLTRLDFQSKFGAERPGSLLVDLALGDLGRVGIISFRSRRGGSRFSAA